MKSQKKSPGVLIFLIIVFFVGLGLKYNKTMINYFGKKQPSGINATIDNKTWSKNTYSNGTVIKSLSDCQVIVRKNMFEPLGGRKIEVSLTNQTAQPTVSKKQEPPKPPPDPIYELVLTGIVFINNELLALIEDSSKGKSYYLRKGDKLKDYVIEEIKDNEVVLVNGDSRITQTLGSKTYYNLNGKLLASKPVNTVVSSSIARETNDRSSPPVAMSNTNSASLNQSSGGSDSSANSGANLSLIEQMKARRKRELGQE